MSKDICREVYQGPSYPQYHGTPCALPANHGGARHANVIHEHEGPFHLTWWTEEEKERIRDRTRREP